MNSVIIEADISCEAGNDDDDDKYGKMLCNSKSRPLRFPAGKLTQDEPKGTNRAWMGMTVVLLMVCLLGGYFFCLQVRVNDDDNDDHAPKLMNQDTESVISKTKDTSEKIAVDASRTTPKLVNSNKNIKIEPEQPSPLMNFLALQQDFALKPVGSKIDLRKIKISFSGEHPSYALLVETIQKAQLDIPEALSSLASDFQTGRGVAQDSKVALGLYFRGAQLGNVECQYRLAVMLESEQHGEDAEAAAMYWYTKAAMQGHSESMNRLGMMLERKQDVPLAVKLYEQGALLGNTNAQVHLGKALETGKGGVPRDLSAAVAWYRQSALGGNVDAQNHWGLMLQWGRGIAKDEGAAVKLYEQAANQGHINAQANLGFMYERGLGTPKNDKKAAEWYERAATQGEPDALNNLGVMLTQGRGVQKNETLAANFFKRAAEKGNMNAFCNLGQMLQHGKGIEKNLTEAVRWYKEAAAMGHSVAQTSLGVMLEMGLGVEKNEAAAAKWYQKAADQGNPDAQNNLGVLLSKGIDSYLPKDDAAAVKLYRQAASNGHIYAAKNLGFMYEHGRGTNKDESQAVHWYLIAAQKGLGSAQLAIGVMLLEGRGIKQDTKVAIEWLKKASEQELAEAQYKLAYLYETGMGNAQIRNTNQAETWYRRAILHGHVQSMYRLGTLLFEKMNAMLKASNSESASTFKHEAIKLFHQASTLGHTDSMNMLHNFEKQ